MEEIADGLQQEQQTEPVVLDEERHDKQEDTAHPLHFNESIERQRVAHVDGGEENLVLRSLHGLEGSGTESNARKDEKDHRTAVSGLLSLGMPSDEP
jgi:hypothetical protein